MKRFYSILFQALLWLATLAYAYAQTPATIYKHTFGTSTINTNPYTVNPSLIGGIQDVKIESSSWSTNNATFINFGGAPTNQGGSFGNALVIQPPTNVTRYIQLDLTIANGYELVLTGYNFWNRKTSNGPATYSLFFNSTFIESGNNRNDPGEFIGLKTLATPLVANGLVTLRLDYPQVTSTNQNIRLDDFELIGFVRPMAIRTAQNGPWDTPSTWVGGVVPTATDHVDILHAVTTSTVVSRGANTLTKISPSGNLQLANGLNLTNSSDVLVEGSLQINAGGYLNGHSPRYATGSNLIYQSGGDYNRSYEWSAFNGTAGTTLGYPYNVFINGATKLHVDTTVLAQGGLGTSGKVTVETFTGHLNFFGSTPGTAALYAKGGLTINGRLTLPVGFGRDLWTGDGITFGVSSTYTSNFRALFLKQKEGLIAPAKGAHLIFSQNATELVVPYVNIDTSTSGQDITVRGLINFATNSANASLTSSHVDDRLMLHQTATRLSIGSTGFASHIASPGNIGLQISSLSSVNFSALNPSLDFKGNPDPNFVVRLAGGNYGTLASAIGGSMLGLQLEINGEARFSNITTSNSGYVRVNSGVLGTQALTNNGLIVDGLSHPTAFLRQYYNIHTKSLILRDNVDSDNGSEPVNITLSASTNANWYTDLQIMDQAYPGISAAHSISRYINTRTNLPISLPAALLILNYLNTDVTGTESEINSYAFFDPNYRHGQAVNVSLNEVVHTTYHLGTAVDTSRIVPVFAIGKPQEIEVYNTTTSTYVTSGQTLDLGTIEVGQTLNLPFRIDNVGGLPLIITTYSTTALSAPYSFTGTSPVSIPIFIGNETVQVNVNPTTDGTFTGTLAIISNDSDESVFTIHFTVQVVPAPPIIQIHGSTSSTAFIGMDEEPNTIYNTIYGATNIGASLVKTFTIRNASESLANLLLTGSPVVTISGANASDFVVSVQPASTNLAAGNQTTFNIRFVPTYTGVRTATIEIATNHYLYPVYRFKVRGTGQCPSRTVELLPASGPVGTWVRMNVTQGTLLNAVVTVDGIPATVSPISNSSIEIQIPEGATYGGIAIDQDMGCITTAAFDLTNDVVNACVDLLPASSSEIYISEFTDASQGSGTYIELTNPGNTAVNLANYRIESWNNGVNANNGGSQNLVGTIAPGGTFVIGIGFHVGTNCSTAGGDGSMANQLSTTMSGVNFDANGNDHLKLLKNLVVIDEWGVQGNANWAISHTANANGIVYRRKPGINQPLVPFNIAQWDYVDWAGSGTTSCSTNDYSHIGISNLTGNPPVITQDPIVISDCKEATLTIAATEGISGGASLTYQWFMHAPGSATWTALTNSGDFQNVTTAQLTITNHLPYADYQFYCLVGEAAITCSSASQAIKFEPIGAVVWNGTSWSPNAPTGVESVRISGDYNTATNGSFHACSVTVDPGVNVVVANGNYIEVDYDLNVAATSDFHVVEGGQFIQTRDDASVTNSGTNRYTRTTTPFVKFDYTYWSSPVSGTTIASTFTGWRTDYAFWMNTSNFADLTGANGVGAPDGHDDNGDDWVHHTGTMEAARGYAVMGPTSGTFPTTRTVTFNGTYHTGAFTMPLMLSANPADSTDDYNLIGNPYPSAIDADAFILANPNTTGSLYFWTHSIPISDQLPGNSSYNFSTNDYAIYNLTGALGTGTPASIPNGNIGASQGFMVIATNTNLAYFNNSMRESANNAQFFRYTSESVQQKDRYWLRLAHTNGLVSETLLGYFSAATLGTDFGYDATLPAAGSAVTLYTLEEGQAFRVQGRPAFEVSDVVRLGYATEMPGPFTFKLTQLDGLFTDENQAVYLQDHVTQTLHNLRDGAYTFTTEIGTFEDRFALRYTTEAELGISDLDREEIRFMSNPNQLGVRAAGQSIARVRIYSMQGQLLFEAKDIDAEEWTIPNPNWARQQVVVKVEMTNGQAHERLLTKY